MTQKERVLRILKRRPKIGVTANELREMCKFDANRRLRELRKTHPITANEEKRPGYDKEVLVYRLEAA